MWDNLSPRWALGDERICFTETNPTNQISRLKSENQLIHYQGKCHCLKNLVQSSLLFLLAEVESLFQWQGIFPC